MLILLSTCPTPVVYLIYIHSWFGSMLRSGLWNSSLSKWSFSTPPSSHLAPPSFIINSLLLLYISLYLSPPRTHSDPPSPPTISLFFFFLTCPSSIFTLGFFYSFYHFCSIHCGSWSALLFPVRYRCSPMRYLTNTKTNQIIYFLLYQVINTKDISK